jgi:hypothetical protein
LQRTLQTLGCSDRLTVELVSGGGRCGVTYGQLLPHVIDQLEAP